MTTTPRSNQKSSSNFLQKLLGNDTFLYIVKRILQALLTIFLASALAFSIMKLAPGDYKSILRNDISKSPERVEEIIQEYGLDKPDYEQYGIWLKNVVTKGDFGESLTYKRPVASLIWERVPATLLLAITSLFITWAIAIPLGIIAAVNQNRWGDRILQVFSYAGQGFPSFITALLLLIFAQITAPIFPVGGMTSIGHSEFSSIGKILDVGRHMILPAIALSITSFAGLQRITRGQMLDVLRQDYIRTARAKGLPENRVIYIHALRNAINPLITILGFELSSLLGGAFIAEFFFNWPGLGRLTLQAVLARDKEQYLFMASLIVSATLLMLGNLIADLLLKVADPRISLDNES